MVFLLDTVLLFDDPRVFHFFVALVWFFRNIYYDNRQENALASANPNFYRGVCSPLCKASVDHFFVNAGWVFALLSASSCLFAG